MKLFLVLLATLVLASAAHAAAPAMTPTLSWSELQALPLPKPGTRIVYGAEPAQFGELRLPDRKKFKPPYPVVILIHGGCWLADYDYGYITRLGHWISGQGLASWTIEYRRLGDEGGGWPGSFQDVAQAADTLREIARSDPLDLNRVFAAGHSAGGQLALWLASRKQLGDDSELVTNQPLPIKGVLGLAAITDLAQYRIGPAESCNASVDRLLGGTPETQPRRYAETSPRARLPLNVRQVFVQGLRDPIVPMDSVRAYVEAAQQAGDAATLLPLAGAGHFETAVPHPASEAALKEALRILQQP